MAKGCSADEHFTVDGTLIEAWAGQKSFKRKDGTDAQPPHDDDPGNPGIDFHGQPRRNATHQSTTDPEARLARKASGCSPSPWRSNNLVRMHNLLSAPM